MIDQQGYLRGFQTGLATAAALARVGCSGDDIGLVLEHDLARENPRQYQDVLGELRRILDIDCREF